MTDCSAQVVLGFHPLRAGDVIVEANGTVDPTSSQVADAAKTGVLLLRVKRGDAYFYAALKK